MVLLQRLQILDTNTSFLDHVAAAGKNCWAQYEACGFSLKLLQGADHLPTIVEPVEPLSRLTSQTPADALRPCCSFGSQGKSAIFFRLVGDQLK